MNVGTLKRMQVLVTAGLLIIEILLLALTSYSRPLAVNLGARIEILDVKNMGLSATDDAKSILQIRWTVEAQPGTTVKSFEISLEVSYADGATEKVRVTTNGVARTARFEVPTVHFAAGRAAAELKSFKAVITANTSETTTRVGSL